MRRLEVEEGKNQLAMQKMQMDAQMSQHEAELKAQGEVAKNTAELQADLATKLGPECPLDVERVLESVSARVTHSQADGAYSQFVQE